MCCDWLKKWQGAARTRLYIQRIWVGFLEYLFPLMFHCVAFDCPPFISYLPQKYRMCSFCAEAEILFGRTPSPSSVCGGRALARIAWPAATRRLATSAPSTRTSSPLSLLQSAIMLVVISCSAFLTPRSLSTSAVETIFVVQLCMYTMPWHKPLQFFPSYNRAKISERFFFAG